MSEQEYGSDLAMSFPKKKRHVPVNISCRARWGIIRVSYIARQKYSWNEIRENRGAVRAILWTLLWRSVFEYSGWDKSALRDAQKEYKKGSNVLYAVLWNFIYFYLPRNDNTASRARIITAARVSAVRILIRARARCNRGVTGWHTVLIRIRFCRTVKLVYFGKRAWPGYRCNSFFVRERPAIDFPKIYMNNKRSTLICPRAASYGKLLFFFHTQSLFLRYIFSIHGW